MTPTLGSSRLKAVKGLAGLVALAGLVSGAGANPDYLQAFSDRYDTRSTLVNDTAIATGSACFVCHNSNAFFGDWNCYRHDLILRLRAGRTIQEALADIESFDSDSDGVNNFDEITRARPPVAGQPQQTGYNPGLIGPMGVDPCYTNGPTLSVTGRLETPPAVVVTGACCEGSTCRVTTTTACTGVTARFVGAGSVCNVVGNSTTPCCFADFNQSGSLSVADIFDFLAAWFGNQASTDFDGVGGTTVQDIFAFLGAWFSGC
jgi:hypothetical protein